MSGNLNPGAGISGPAYNAQTWGGKILPLLPEDIRVTNMGGGFYQLDFPRIAQTGADVQSNYPVPFPHVIHAIFVKHVDANLANAATALIFKVKFALRENLYFALASFNSVASDEAFMFPGSEGAKNATSYIFNTETTNGHYVYISMIVQALGMI